MVAYHTSIDRELFSCSLDRRDRLAARRSIACREFAIAILVRPTSDPPYSTCLIPGSSGSSWL